MQREIAIFTKIFAAIFDFEQYDFPRNLCLGQRND